MNSLSLRISSSTIKTDSKKHVNNENDLFKMEQQLIIQQKEEFQEFLVELNESATIERQLEVIRKISKCQQKEEAIQLLIDIYFLSKLKHPIKKFIISSVLSSMKNEEELVVDCMIKKIASEIEKATGSSLHNKNYLVSTINESLQNFKPAISAIGRSTNILLQFILKYLEDLTEELSAKTLSPSQRNEISLFVHHSLQLTIYCMKNNILGTPVKFSIRDSIDEITSRCDSLLEIPEIPMDTKINCGIVIVLKYRINNQSDFVDFILDENSSVAKKLALIIGNISSMENTDFPFLAMTSEILKEIFDSNSIEPSITLVVCRSYLQITKKLALGKYSSDTLEEDAGNIDDICDLSLSFAFLNIEHFMDSVRHISRDIIKNLVDFGVKNEKNCLVDKIFDMLESVDSMSLKSVIIISISGGLSVDKILQKIPDLRSFLLNSLDSENVVQNQNIVNCYDTLLTKEHGKDLWFEIWIDPLIKKLLATKTSEIKLSLENLIKKSIKKDSRIVGKILEHPSSNHNPSFILLCVGEAKKQGCYDGIESSNLMWKKILKFEVIKTAMLSGDENSRIAAISLIVDSRKTTEFFCEEEFECILHFLIYNINVQSPSIRQKIMGILKNVFLRIQAGIPVLKKSKNPLLDVYRKFLVKLQEFSLGNLQNGANFTRRCLSLQILNYILKIIEQYFQEIATEIWNLKKIGILVNCLSDSYESNKEIAMQILKLIPKEILYQENSINLEVARKLMISVKPTDCLVAAYYLEFLANFKQVRNSEIVYSEFYLLIVWCEEILEEGRLIAKKSLLKAARINPLYGPLFCIRHLLEKLDLKKIHKFSDWQKLYGRLIDTCKDLTDIVGPIVNNDSPEGILPKEDCEELETTPQMVLLMAWRTVKEVSLLLGDICLRTSPKLVTSQQILYICNHFIELLSKTKHRGAFEQAFVGFSKLCLRLWSENNSDLHTIPKELMEQLMLTISGEENDADEMIQLKNLCATRRSAGLPFLILGLVTSEIKVSTTKGLQYCMENLIKFSLTGNLESKTHSLNILRALFRSTDLGEAIGEFVGDGIKVALLGYSSENWVVRNSSTLLFSSLIVRIFGVQRTKDSENLNIRNRMTARIFFLRYPQLYDFIQQQLEEARELVLKGIRNPKLHPLLLLLNRLYSSALDGTENNLKLTNFIPLVSICSGCMEMQTRVLAGRFIAIVISPDLIASRILRILGIITPDTSLNSVHGALLQVLFMIRSTQELYKSNLKKDEWKQILEVSLEKCGEFKENLILFSTLLEIILEIFAQNSWLFEEKSKETQESLENILRMEISCSYGISLVDKNLVLLEMVLMKLKKSYSGDMLIDFKVNDTRRDYLDSILNSILLLFDVDYMELNSEEFNVKERQIQFTSNLFNEEESKILLQNLKEGEILRKNLCEMIQENYDYHATIKSYRILGFLNVSEEAREVEAVLKLIDDLNGAPDHIKSSMLVYLNACFKESLEIDSFDLDFLLAASLEGSYFVKSAITDILWTIIQKFSTISSLDVFLSTSRCILMLLMDDDCQIRERNSKIVAYLLKDEKFDDILPIYAQEVYLNYLTEFLREKFGELEILALLLALCLDDNSDDFVDSNMADFRVFDQQEANIFCEFFVLKNQVLEVIEIFINKNGLKLKDHESEILKITATNFKNQKYHNSLLKNWTDIRSLLED